ncbi:hypothetical protein WR25_12186 [Diploscapter pachys]|uniref:Vacuolar protein sorting-associated protein 18 homolog n=1 Tax=Diploscapter pachys TaxID=2018661 RepID=A0A2A2LWJ6_9BILA|nr:hypothetical protein WR25_12186 [Diploscapter pachys]
MSAGSSNSSPAKSNSIFLRTASDFKRDLSHLVVSNGELLVAISPTTLLHQPVKSTEKRTEIKLPLTPEDGIRNVHLSTSGQHALISSKQGNNFYARITAVGWHPSYMKESETGNILLGTDKGAIIEIAITSNGSVSFIKEIVACFGDEAIPLPISDIRLCIVNNEDETRAEKWVAFICQPGKLHYVYGSVQTTPLKHSYVSSASLQSGWMSLAETTHSTYQTLFTSKDRLTSTLNMESDELDSPQQGQSARSRQASGSPNEKIISQLCLHPHYQDPQRFAWLGPRGVRIGKVDLNPDRPMDILVEEQRIPPRRVEGRLECPLAISLSEFHVLLLFPSRIQALSIYTKEVMYEDSLTLDVGVAVGLSCDPTSEFHYLFTPTTTIKYRPNDENRYVWRVFLESGEYAKALAIARVRQQLDPAAYQYVLRRQADKYITDKNYTAAAEILSESTESFETIVLKFLSTDGERRGGLKLLLENKLVKCNSSSPEERMKRDAIVLWLLEEQLTELSELRKELSKQQEAAEQMAHLKRFFIKKPVLEAIQTHQKAVYRLISSHADLEVQLFLANALKDYDVALNIYLVREQYKDALDLINSLGNPKLLYAFGPKIVPYIPAQLFGSIIGNEQISPLKLFPTLVLCQEKENMAIQALKYLEWVITTQIGEHWRELHNMIILLYARFRPKKLHQYLLDGGSNKHNLPYDLDFAIRTCVQYKQEKSLIYLYCVSELFSEAVDRALKESLDLAKECAHLMDEEDELSFEPKYPKEMRRNIWMKIAKHIITKENNAVKCIDLLKESKDALSIQDVLPLFPEFTKIEHFKEPLCECLKDHSVKIQDLQDKMKEAMQIAEEIRVKTDKLQERVIVIKPGDMCASCSKGLSGRPFYAHACRHFFHRECLEDIAMSFLNESEKKKLEKLIDEEQKILQRLELNERVGSKADVEQLEVDYEKRAMAIDNLLGAECPLCGNRAIE